MERSVMSSPTSCVLSTNRSVLKKPIYEFTHHPAIEYAQCCRFVCVRLAGVVSLVNEMPSLSLSSSHFRWNAMARALEKRALFWIFYQTKCKCPRQMTDNVGAYAVAGLGGLENGAKRNVKPDQLRTVHEPKWFNKTNLRNYTTPRYWICTMLAYTIL